MIEERQTEQSAERTFCCCFIMFEATFISRQGEKVNHKHAFAQPDLKESDIVLMPAKRRLPFSIKLLIEVEIH